MKYNEDIIDACYDMIEPGDLIYLPEDILEDRETFRIRAKYKKDTGYGSSLAKKVLQGSTPVLVLERHFGFVKLSNESFGKISSDAYLDGMLEVLWGEKIVDLRFALYEYMNKGLSEYISVVKAGEKR